MRRQAAATKALAAPPARKWLMGAVALLVLGAVAAVDAHTGKDFTFTLLYLAPVAIAVWFAGSWPGLLMCFLAAASSLIIELREDQIAAVAVFNTCIRLGVYLAFYALLNYLREHKGADIATPLTRKWMAIGTAALCLALVVAGVVHRQTVANTAAIDVGTASNIRAAATDGPLAELISLVTEAGKVSRPLLLGSRDPNGGSCVKIARTGDVQGVMPENPGDLDGGPGTSMAVLYYFDRRDFKSPMQDFRWHQNRFRTYLENNVARGAQAEELVRVAAEKASAFLDVANSWTIVPARLAPTGYNRRDDWLGYCLSSLDQAVGRGDAASVQHWAQELAAAAFWLEDLLRWRSFLYTNHLAALDFQARCQTLFESAEKEHSEYKPDSTMSQFPAGVLGLNGKGNLYEVERQAERLFSMPADRLIEIAENKHLTPNSVWLPPGAREAFLQLRSVLSPENQTTWDLAARTPYQHSYLVNLLFRARTAELVDDLAEVLKKFDARNPHATVNELMSVMMYRGHSFAGIEWGDRFQPQLMEAAASIDASANDVDALQAAWAWTNRFYKSPAEYAVTFTLRDALDQKKLDCVRATDMIAAIFRNAGRTGLGHVRWCCETGGHSVATYMGLLNEPANKILLADGLTSPREPEVWPNCYFHGHDWPPGLENNKQPYAMELYVRGIDSYVWLQGYIVRGPNAGWLTTTSIPYSKHFQTPSERKVFDGPYPE
jgi:hypothetical protein